MLKGALLLTGLVLLAFGAEGLFYAAANRQQTTITCEAFAQSPPRALWLRVTGCELDYMGAGYRDAGGRIAELYFPARPAGWRDTSPAPIVATTRDPSVLALADGTIGAGRTPDQEQFLVMMLKIVTVLRASREIEGYASAGLFERLRARRAVAGLSTPLSSSVVVLDMHAKPSYIVPAAAALAGVLLLALFFTLRSRRRSELPAETQTEAIAPPVEPSPSAEVAPPSSGEPFVPPSPEPVLEGGPRLRVMLLNLPPDAGLETVESAPPLGRREDVVAAIAQVLPHLHFDASGRASVRRSDFVLVLDIGRTDPIYTVVLDAQGEAALPIVGAILDRTRWRAFEARSGSFISHDRLAAHTAA